jgi:hypothetical protein
MRIMTGILAETPRDDFMLVAEKEMVAFERKERELRRQERLECHSACNIDPLSRGIGVQN